MEPFLVSTHVEEGLVGILACGVIRIDVHLFATALVHRLLNVPENVSGDLLEDSGFQGRCETCVECATQIGGVVVLFALLEGVELTSKDLVPLLEIEALSLKLIVHGGVNLRFILSVNLLHILDLIEENS